MGCPRFQLDDSVCARKLQNSGMVCSIVEGVRCAFHLCREGGIYGERHGNEAQG